MGTMADAVSKETDRSLLKDRNVTLVFVLGRNMIQEMIKEGKIVPSEATVRLLQRAMLQSHNDKFRIDEFPRNEENRLGFEALTDIEPVFVLFFDCSEEEMEKPIRGRNQGWEDDNVETIRKRLKVFLESRLPVIQYYESEGNVRGRLMRECLFMRFSSVKTIVSKYEKKWWDTPRGHNLLLCCGGFAFAFRKRKS